MSGDVLSNQWSKSTETSNVEVYRSKDNQVAKYVHADGSETTIKTVASCANEFNLATGAVEPIEVDRRKFTVFISASVGCPVGCKFCYLTSKKFPYYKLTPQQIINNVKEAVNAEVQVKPELRKKYVKLSWMGMGDAFLMDPKDLASTSYDLAEWIVGDSGRAFGLDGVDIATCYPRTNYGWPHHLAVLNDRLEERFRLNPNRPERSAVRLFYSLHVTHNRRDIIPLAREESPSDDLFRLEDFRKWYGIDVVLHHMFLEGINDDEETLERIKTIVYEILVGAELRILRFNECKGSIYKESSKFDELVRLYAASLPRIKYQISPGSEIQAACGQFLCLTTKQK
jgi:adenine C2-methylase RlmN of 23S rRNA A2503 and tRNA A37